jgi:hypothetical protein
MAHTELGERRERAKLEDMGIYLRLISSDYPASSNNELATLISEQFNVDCREEDIEGYERMHRIMDLEDLEKLNRMQREGFLEHQIE